NLSGISGEIDQATVRLRLTGNMTVAGMTNEAEWIEDDSWSESAITWNNKPPGSGVVLGEWRIPTSPRLLTGGGVLQSLVDLVDRDGNGNEGAPGYNRLWLDHFIDAADVLDGYDLYPVADLYQNVKFRKLFSGLYPLLLSEIYTPTIGDYGKTGNPAREVKLNTMVKAFEHFGDPIFAQVAYMLNNHSTAGLHGDIWSSDPDGLADQIADRIEQYGPLNLPSVNMTGYGFSALRDGDNPTGSYGLVYKFPALDIVQQSASVKLFEDSGTVQFEATAPGETLTFSFDVAAADEYELAILPFKAASYGIYRISVDGSAIGQLDFYGGNGTGPETISTLWLTAGSHTISFEGIGKQPSATNYKMGVKDLILLDEAARHQRDEQQSAENTLRDLWMYYGRTVYHGHRDTLNLGLHAFGLDLAPDLGYPEFANDADPHRHQWVNNTVSHNTVVVDKTKQRSQWVATPRHFDDSGQVKLIDVEAPQVYPGTELYRRSTAMIRVDEANSYAVDFFRVEGGSDHHFSFHGPDAAVTTENLNLTPQPTGTYAGETVGYGECPGCATGNYTGSGFHYLKQVRRDNNPAAVSIDWQAKDTWNVLGNGAGAQTDVHLRLTMLGETDSVTLAAGVPPQNKPGNPPSLTYMLAHRQGANLKSAFTSVLEPYKGTPFVQAVEAVPVKAAGVLIDETDDIRVRAVKVSLANGRVDYIVSALDPTVEYTVDDKLAFKGFFGVYAEKQGQRVFGYVHDGSYIAPLSSAPVDATGRLEGAIVDFTRELALQNHLDVSFATYGPAASTLAGRWIYVQNDGVRNAAYEIRGAETLGGGIVRLQLGDATLVRQFVDAADFAQGYVYDVGVGQPFYIPLTVSEGTASESESPNGEPEALWRALEALVPSLRESGELEETLSRQLVYRLGIIGLLKQQGAGQSAIAYLEDFTAYIQAPALLQQGLIGVQAVAELNAAAAKLLASWRS
ncbi:hypothetical protein FE784_23675, partial [Paenibacillus hemerocallicola]